MASIALVFITGGHDREMTAGTRANNDPLSVAPHVFAIIDDLGAIVIMALFYAGNLSTTALLIALAGLAVGISDIKAAWLFRAQSRDRQFDNGT